jgi:DNA-binding NtrC family response regulator
MDAPPAIPESTLLGASAVMRDVRAQLVSLAVLPWHVRIEGPTGSGKGLAARVLHGMSARAGAPFVCCHINALADGLEVAELVGHARGAFTGAVGDRPGVFEAAHGGTLFVDEVATASPRTQLALLQLVDEGAVQRLGERRLRRVDVRAVFATNADLWQAVRAGTFREDLYHRLGVLVVRMPALRDHREDIPELAYAILTRKARDVRMESPVLERRDLERLMAFDWPGNVRQLEHVLEHFLAFGRIPDVVRRVGRVPSDWQAQISEAVRRHEGNKAAAARELGISRKTLYRRLAGGIV